MASVNDQKKHTESENKARKASSLTPRETESGEEKRSRNRAGGNGEKAGALRDRGKGVIIADILLVFLLILLVGGGIFGYRALKNAYAPQWETREVIFLVEIPHMDDAIVPDSWNQGANAYLSDRADALPVATLYDVPYILSSKTQSEEAPYKTVRIALKASARYRETMGYYCGELHLLAGTSLTLRVDKISASGVVVAVYELSEYPALETGASTAQP